MEDTKKEQLERSNKRLAKIIYNNREKILADNAKFEPYIEPYVEPKKVMKKEEDVDLLDKFFTVTRIKALTKSTKGSLFVNSVNIARGWKDGKKNVTTVMSNYRDAIKIAARNSNRNVAKNVVYREAASNLANKRLANTIKNAKRKGIPLLEKDINRFKQIFKGDAQTELIGKMTKGQTSKYNNAMNMFQKDLQKNPKMKKLLKPYGVRNLITDKIANTKVGRWLGGKVTNSKTLSKVDDTVKSITNSKFLKGASSKVNDLAKATRNSKFIKTSISKVDDAAKAVASNKAFKFGKKALNSKLTKGLGKAFTGMGYAMNTYTILKDESKFKKVLAGIDLIGDVAGTALASTGVLAPLGGAISFGTSALNFAGSWAYDKWFSDSLKNKLDNISGKYVVDPIAAAGKKLWGAAKNKVKAFKKNPIKELAKTSMAIANPLGYGAFKLGKKIGKPFMPKITSALKTAKDTVSNSIKTKMDAFKKNPVKEVAKTLNPVGYGAFKLGQKSAEALKVKAAPLISKAAKQIQKAKKKSLNFIKSMKDRLFKEGTNNSFNPNNRLNKIIKGRTRGIGITNQKKPSEKLIRGVRFKQRQPSSSLIDLYHNESRGIKNNNTKTNYNRRVLEAKLLGTKKHNSNKNNFTININGSGLSVDDMANELASKIQTTMANMYA
ncbi:hypothetical protein R9X47_18115 [Wukongibacter baidiensis]|uniref:hypothetical protein n=1 Tax=Wukongibacter baidiensis TaxID=1723361 RepID=UPI003D7FC47F